MVYRSPEHHIVLRAPLPRQALGIVLTFPPLRRPCVFMKHKLGSIPVLKVHLITDSMRGITQYFILKRSSSNEE